MSTALTWVLIAALLVVTTRRYWFLVASLLPARPVPADYCPPVSLLVSARDEEHTIASLLECIERLDYPRDALYIVVVSDGSRDSTPDILERWASVHPPARHLALAENAGKAGALNRGLALAPPSELVAVYDADQRPRPDALRILAGAFSDPGLGAVAGYRCPVNGSRTPVSRYAALECWVHQWITQAAKDRLRANPTTMGGNCVYRRDALQKAGGFPAGALSEDIEVSLALVADGFSTRFIPAAVAEQDVVETLGQYWRQRLRWTSGIYSSSRKAKGLESWMVSLGYADRLVLVAAAALAVAGKLHPLWLALYLAAPLVAMSAALARAKEASGKLQYLAWSLPMFAVDIGITVCATLRSMRSRRPDWQTDR